MAILGPLNPLELARSGGRLVSAAAQRVRPDHQAIAMRTVRFSPQNMTRLYLYVVVAPSRFAPRPFDDGQVRRARGFVAAAFPGVFDDIPTSAEEHTTLFTVDSEQDHYRERALYVHRTGLIELLWALDYGQTEDALVLDSVEMACVIVRLASAVARAPYAELSRAGRGRRRFARVDWWFHAATAISTATGPRTWTALRFPGAEPPRAKHDWAAAPPGGYGYEQLLNSRRSRPPEQIARTFLIEFLRANGYYEFGGAVEEILTEARSRVEGGDIADRADHHRLPAK